MPKKKETSFVLPSLDDIFSTQEMRDDEKLRKVRDIPIELIDDFPDHPFKVIENDDMMELAESIRNRGVLTPTVVREKEDGRYEMVSGHRRKYACQLIGLETIPAEVRELDRDDATLYMVESNLQRSVILPSEKAFSCKMQLEAMKRKAGRPSKNGAPVEHNLKGLKSRELLRVSIAIGIIAYGLQSSFVVMQPVVHPLIFIFMAMCNKKSDKNRD